MHLTTLVFHLFTFFNVVNTYPIPSWSDRSSSNHSLLVPFPEHMNWRFLRMRRAASPAVNPTQVQSATSLPPASSIIPSTSTTPLTRGISGSQKYVVAHHMVGNTYPYTLKDWADDIVLAHNSGIDGFALNMGREVWEPARVSDAYVLTIACTIN